MTVQEEAHEDCCGEDLELVEDLKHFDVLKIAGNQKKLTQKVVASR